MQTALDFINIDNFEFLPLFYNSAHNNHANFPFQSFPTTSPSSHSAITTPFAMDRRNLVHPSPELPGFAALMDSVQNAWKSLPDAETYLRPTALLSKHQPQTHLARHSLSPCYRDEILSASSSRSTDIAHGNQESPRSTTDGLQRSTVSPPVNRHIDWKGPKACATLPRTPRVSFSISKSSSKSKRSGYWEIVMSPSAPRPVYEGAADPSDPMRYAENGSESDRKSPDSPCEERPYGCSLCDARFRKRCNLMTHISNVHDKIKPYYCSICMRRFARKSNCGKHVSCGLSFCSSKPFLKPNWKERTSCTNFGLFLSTRR